MLDSGRTHRLVQSHFHNHWACDAAWFLLYANAFSVLDIDIIVVAASNIIAAVVPATANVRLFTFSLCILQ
jgi:hypothetical protein